jgi:uncharacterized protein (TIGR02186 family)
MTRLAAAAALALCLAGAAMAQEQAQPDASGRQPLPLLSAGLAQDVVEVKVNYSGASIVLLAALPPSEPERSSLAVALIGPPERVRVVRRTEDARGSFDFAAAPAVFVTGAEPGVLESVPPAVLREAGLDAAAAAQPSGRDAGQADVDAWRAALIALKAEQDAYMPAGAVIERIGGGLVRARMQLPPNSPPGDYQVRAVLFRDGRPVAAAERPLTLVRGGMDATMYDLATRHSFIYGIVGVLLGALVGAVGAFLGRR